MFSVGCINIQLMFAHVSEAENIPRKTRDDQQYHICFIDLLSKVNNGCLENEDLRLRNEDP